MFNNQQIFIKYLYALGTFLDHKDTVMARIKKSLSPNGVHGLLERDQQINQIYDLPVDDE